jgi:hypothetical protein
MESSCKDTKQEQEQHKAYRYSSYPDFRPDESLRIGLTLHVEKNYSLILSTPSRPFLLLFIIIDCRARSIF